MTPAEWFVLALVLGAVALFATELLPVDVVGMLVMMCLLLSQVLTPEQALAGFANPALIAVGALFIVSEGVVRTGAVEHLGRAITAATGGRSVLMVPLVLVLVLVASAFVNNTPVVVLAVPVVIGQAERHGISPSKVLMPISFASILGGCCTLIGTSTNLLINTAADRPGFGEPLKMFDFMPLGLVFAAVGMVYLLLVAPRLLPARKNADRVRPDLLKEYLTEVRIGLESPLIGQSVAAMLGAVGATATTDETSTKKRLRPLELIRRDEVQWPPLDDVTLEAGDVVLIKGGPDTVAQLLRRGVVELPTGDSSPEHPVVDPSTPPAVGADEIRGGEWTLAEVVLTPSSWLVGRTLERASFRRHYGVNALALQRSGEHIRSHITQVRLKVGDVLLVQGNPGTIEALRAERDFLLLEGAGREPEVPERAWVATSILVAVVLGAGLGVYPMVVCALAGAVAMVLTGCVSSRRAYQAVQWDLLVLVGGMIALGVAMEQTGLARTLAELTRGAAMHVGGDWRPYIVLAAFYLLVTVLSNFVSNNAAALLFVPLALETAAALDVSARPFLFAVAYAASAAFALPIGYNTHLLVYGPGGYKLRDFLLFGTPLNLLLWLVASVLLPVFWPFQP